MMERKGKYRGGGKGKRMLLERACVHTPWRLLFSLKNLAQGRWRFFFLAQLTGLIHCHFS
jgi:hypothetical protein